jgi:hypothetical protein
MHSQYRVFFLIVMLVTAFDNAMFTGILWMSLKASDSALPLGIVLCCSVAIPFALDIFSRGRAGQISMSGLSWVRVGVFVAVTFATYENVNSTLAGFLCIALVVGIADYMTVNSLETENVRRVVARSIGSETAARYMQTAIQLGGFSGALIGGALLDVVSGTTFIFWVSIGAGVTSLSLRYASMARRAGEQEHNSVAQDSLALKPAGSTDVPRFAMPYGLLISLGLIGFHIGAFNSMLPVVYQKVNGWSPAVFGFASGAAGVGAFLAALLPPARVRVQFVAIVLVIVDAAMVLMPVMLASMAAASLVGFATNHLRIVVRTRLMLCARNDAEAAIIGSRSAFWSLSTQAAAPLLLTTLVSSRLFGFGAGPATMVAVGAMLALGLLVICYIADARPSNEAPESAMQSERV